MDKPFALDSGLMKNIYQVLCSTVIHFSVLVEQELDHVVEELGKIAVVNLLPHKSIISLIGNVQCSSLILEKVPVISCYDYSRFIPQRVA